MILTFNIHAVPILKHLEANLWYVMYAYINKTDVSWLLTHSCSDPKQEQLWDSHRGQTTPKKKGKHANRKITEETEIMNRQTALKRTTAGQYCSIKGSQACSKHGQRRAQPIQIRQTSEELSQKQPGNFGTNHTCSKTCVKTVESSSYLKIVGFCFVYTSFMV